VRENTFDYIIAGGGMAGLSLAFYLNESPTLRGKKTLIIDRDYKNTNDHTWCFWEKHPGAFDKIVFRRWKKVWFHGTKNFSKLLNLGEYEYKMIRAEDFYKHIADKLKANKNFIFLRADILQADVETVKTSEGDFTANEFIFDSFTRKSYDNPKYQNLWQHFTGFTIETEKPAFNTNEPTLFDFRVEQKNECRFCYVLPVSETKALIEYTVFSDNLLPAAEYEFFLRKYVAEVLRVENYKILETETGIIPMSDEPHEENPSPKIIRIGTAGGCVKPSTGYSFRRTQKKLKRMVEDLETSDSRFRIPDSGFQNWKIYLDSVMLNVLRTKKHPADDVFTRLFARNEPKQILKFLDEDTSVSEDVRIMKTVPLYAFTKAAAQVWVGKKH
jgi:lycopene beta-cyclase